MKFSKFIFFCFILILKVAPSIGQPNQAARSDSSQRESSKWIKELKNIIISPPKQESETDTFNIESPNYTYLGAEGMTIAQIRIIRLDPFGASINDTIVREVNWLQKAGNKTHVLTREYLIRNSLLFRVGDKVKVLTLADSERYLRSLDFINDARISVNQLSDNTAEVMVVIQDIESYAFAFGTNFSSRMNLSATDRNILGLGVELKVGTFLDGNKDHLWGYESNLKIHNIAHSFISFDATYLNKYETQQIGVVFNRDFFSPSTKYAGNLTLFNSRIGLFYYVPNEPIANGKDTTVRFNNFDGWIGRSFQIKENLFDKKRTNVTVAVRTQRIDFTDRPENAQTFYYQFQNRTVFLGSLSLSQQAYYKTNLIYNYGRTEDIPYGYLASIVIGREHNELYHRNYAGANFSSGYFIPKIGYLSGAISYGTFFRNSPEQGSIDVALNYFTNLYVIGAFRMRSFANIQYTRQLDAKYYDDLDIEGEVGIPGFRNDSIRGRHRLTLNLEQDLFAPWKVIGFNIVAYAFGNFSWLGDYGERVFQSSLYNSFGIGFRIRNNRLIINTLQVRFAYFPNIPPNSGFKYVEFSKETLLRPRNFSAKAPEIVPLY